jgi:hypothetical protein
MSTIKSFETFINEGLTNQYLPVNEGFDKESYTYQTTGSSLRPMQYFDSITSTLSTGTLTKGNIPGYLGRYGNFEGKTANQIYQELIKNPALAEIDALITKKAQSSGTAEELSSWKANTDKQLLYTLLLVDLNSNNREDMRAALNKGRSSVIVSDIETKKKITSPGSIQNKPDISTEPNATPVPFTYTQDGSKGDVFVINEWILSNSFKAELDARIKDIKETIDLLNPPAGKPKAFCSEIKIESSCSTAPNGTPKSSPNASKYSGTKISFIDLSTERANAVLNYIKTGLSSVGVLVDADTKVTIQAAGQNGDGTSGPAWNTVQGLSNEEKLSQVRQYQMAKADFVILFNDTTIEITPSDEKKPEGTPVPPEMVEVPVDEYKLTIAINTFRLKIRFPDIYIPRIQIRWPKLGLFSGNRRRYPRLKCYKF